MKNVLNKKDLEFIRVRIADLKRDDLPIWGKMNVGEMLCHVADQIKTSTGEIKVEDRSTFKMRFFVKNLILLGVHAPKGKAETMPEINPQKHGSKPVSFEADRDYLLRKIDEFVSFDESKLQPHALFGKLSKRKWGRVIYMHLDHHLNQFGS